MKKQIQQLIAEGKTEQAIKLLLELTQKLPDTDLHGEVTHHAATFSKYAKTQRLGTESTDEQNLAYAKINRALIGVLEQLPESGASKFALSNKSSGPNIVKIGVLALLVFSLLGLAYLYFSPQQETYNCNGLDCPTCEDCYDRGCFKAAYDCFSAMKSRDAEQENKRKVSGKIIDADQNWAKVDLVLAKKFYLEAIELDSGVYVYRQKNLEGIDLIQSANLSLTKGALSDAKASYTEAQMVLKGVESAHGDIDVFILKKLEEIEELEQKEGPVKPRSLQSILEGKWLQSKSGKDGEIIGEIRFKFSENTDTPVVSYQNKYSNGTVHQGELINLEFSPDQNLLKGIWHNFNTQRKGDFYFEVDTSQGHLSGKYSLAVGEKPTYYWNGDIGGEN